MPFRFEGLEIWQRARRFANDVYRVTATFPEHERYGLASQMTRAATSISLNIAEGSGRESAADFSRFLGIAVGSTFEVVSAAFIAMDQGYIEKSVHEFLYKEAQQLGKSINSFRKSLK